VAAQRIVCFPPAKNVWCVRRFVIFTLTLLLPLLLGTKCIAASTSVTANDPDSVNGALLFHASLNEITLEEKIVEVPTGLALGNGPQNEEQPFIERIDFEGNRRIRRDTLQARIFTRVGDPYNEETLRRDFQALWNTQFFEDVKLRVEDGEKPNGKIIVFEVKERPVIRRIRYDGIHSISESDILDRFKEKKSRVDRGKPV